MGLSPAPDYGGDKEVKYGRETFEESLQELSDMDDWMSDVSP